MNVVRENESDATMISLLIQLSLPAKKKRTNAANEIKEKATTGNSYPIAIVFRAKVGLKARKIASKYETLETLVFLTSSINQIEASVYKAL